MYVPPSIMEATIPTPPASSTLTDRSSTSLQTSPSHLLEINLISALDLPRISKSMKTYAIAWLNPDRKLTTRVDSKGNANPYWYEKLLFRVDEDILFSENSLLTIEIYNVSWFRDLLVGTVRIPLIDLISPSKEKRFVTLQVRRPGGEPQGILNTGFCLGGSGNETIPSHEQSTKKEDKEEELDEEEKERRIRIQEKIQLWRSRYVENHNDYDEGSVVNPGSMVNYGSEVCSDIGPSASIVAAELANTHRPPVRQPAPSMSVALPPRAARSNIEGDDLGSSILEELTREEAMARGWMDDFPAKKREVSSRNRRHSDGDGSFACYGTMFGVEFRIVCGNNKQVKNSNKKGQNKKRWSSAIDKPRKSM